MCRGFTGLPRSGLPEEVAWTGVGWNDRISRRPDRLGAARQRRVPRIYTLPVGIRLHANKGF